MKLLPIIFAVSLAGCASEPPRVASTTWPQAVVNAPKNEVHERLVAAAASTGGSIEASTDSLIQVRAPDPQASMAKVFFGCPSCGDPYLRLNFVLSTIGAGTQVVAQYWRVIPKANGAEDRMEVTGNADFNQAQQMLWGLRDQYASKP
jgi:hypothetical protein